MVPKAGALVLPSEFIPIMFGSMRTLFAPPFSSMPFPTLPEMMLVRMMSGREGSPPVDVINTPSFWFGAAGPKAVIPEKVLKVVKLKAVSVTSTPLPWL